MKKEKCQKWDSNPRRENPTATWTQRLRPLMINHPDNLRYMLFCFVHYSYCVKWKGKNVRSGIRTHAGNIRLRPKRSVLDCSAILTISTNFIVFYIGDYNKQCKMKRKNVRSGTRTHAGRTRLRPERSALDRSAILTFSDKCYSILLCWLQLITV